MRDNKLIHRIEKIVMGFVPIIGTMLAVEDEERLNDEVEFLQEIVQEVKVQIMNLEIRMDAEYVSSKEYKNYIHNTVRKAINDLRKEKIKLFANIIVNAALKENTEKEYNRKYLYLDTIDKIDEHLFRFVCLLKSRSITKGKEIGKGWTGDEPELKQMGIYDEFRFNADYLLSLGLIVRLHLERHDDKKSSLAITDEYYVTEYGAEFVKFVSEQGSNYFEEAEEVS